jgi:hypothetical protein
MALTSFDAVPDLSWLLSGYRQLVAFALYWFPHYWGLW